MSPGYLHDEIQYLRIGVMFCFIFNLQIAGSLAEEGKSLEEISQVAKAAAQAMGI